MCSKTLAAVATRRTSSRACGNANGERPARRRRRSSWSRTPSCGECSANCAGTQPSAPCDRLRRGRRGSRAAKSRARRACLRTRTPTPTPTPSRSASVNRHPQVGGQARQDRAPLRRAGTGRAISAARAHNSTRIGPTSGRAARSSTKHEEGDVPSKSHERYLNSCGTPPLPRDRTPLRILGPSDP